MPETHTKKNTSPLAIWRWPLHWQILIGLVLGGGLGFLSAITALSAAAAQGNAKLAESIVLQRWDYLIYNLVGDLFINGLKLIIVPLVTSSIIMAIVGIGAQGRLGWLGLKTLTYYLTTSLIAILIGLALINLVAPGFDADGVGILQDRDLSAFAAEQAQIVGKAQGKTATSFLDVFREMVPANVVKAAADEQLLGLIVVSLLVGYFLARLPGPPGDAVRHFIQGVYDITLKITDLVLRFAPIGVAMLIAATVAQYYAKLYPDDRFREFITSIVTFAGTALAALLLHFFIVMPVILSLVARVNPIRHYHAMAPALMAAFSTASSSATLPVTMECVEERAGVSNKTAGFVLPLGATVNMDGTALYECVAAIFICQAFGVHLTLAQQFYVVVVALLTSIGVAGVPSASIVAIVLILTTIGNQVGLPLVAGLGLIWVFDRPLDMCRTAVNIFSDSVGSVVVARSEGENPLSQPVRA